MIVRGVNFSDSFLEKVWESAATEGLTFSSLQRAFMRLGISPGRDTVYRAADRLLQKKRKEGVVRYVEGKWELI